MTTPIVIVGAGLAGAKAAETLREEGFAGPVVLVGQEPYRPYERPPLSKGLLLGSATEDDAYVHPTDWYRSHDVELRLGTRVEAIDTTERTMTVAGGQSLAYDKLLLATGASPRRLDVPGSDLDNVRYLRDLPDAEALSAALTEGSQVVIIGAGWIGLEVAAAARSRGASVTVVEAAPLPLRRVLGDEVGRLFHRWHTEHGVTFHLEASVARLRGDTAVRSVVLASGEEIPADVVVVGVGVVADTRLAEAAGLATANGVTVDSSLRTSDPHVFAAGDVASAQHPRYGRHIRVEHWATAMRMGQAAAKAMLGQDVSYDEIPYFFSDQYDVGMEYSGWVEPGGYDEVVFRGDPAGSEFLAFWIRDGHVVAGMNVNVWDVHDDIRALIDAGLAGKAVDLARLTDPDLPLSDV